MRQLSTSALTLTLLGSACAHETQADLSVFAEEVTGSSGSAGGGAASTSVSGSAAVMAGSSAVSRGGTFGASGATSGGVPAFSGAAMGGAAGTTAGGGAGGAAGTAGSAGKGGMPPVGGQECQTGKLTATAAAASSTEDAGALGAPLAMDGMAGTRWSSAHSQPEWLALDLGEVSHVSRVVIRWEAAFATRYRVEISDDQNGPWRELFEDDEGDGGTDDVSDFAAEDGRYVRMFGVERATVFGFSILEMELYGDPDATCRD